MLRGRYPIVCLFRPSDERDESVALAAMERYIVAIRKWMISDRLLMNSDRSKTEVLLIGTRQQLSKVNIDNVKVCSADIAPSLQFKSRIWVYGLIQTYLCLYT